MPSMQSTTAGRGQQLRPHRRRNRSAATLLLAVWLGGLAAVNFTAQTASRSEVSPFGVHDDCRHSSRHLLEFNESCTPRSIETFPPDPFTLEQKKHGAIIVHILLAIWLFAALAVVCDDYFVASLELICEALDLKSDVAGATFMAAGSSAPELFTSIIGVFFAQSDVGVSTIVGSAVFNILFIVSMCGLFATQTIFLSWWPIFRDCGFYCLSVIALIVVIQDGEVHWYEALIFICMYVIYIGLMYFNESLDAKIREKFPAIGTQPQQQQQQQRQRQDVESNVDEERIAIVTASGGDGSGQNGNTTTYSQLSLANEKPMVGDVEIEEEFESPFEVPESLGKRIYWTFMLPWTCLFVCTIPDCRRGGCWRKTFPFTFVMSIVWIAGMSYLLVWMVCATGDTFGIPDTVMGLTLLAAGTSVPDAMASVFVARDGLGDMAVSNSIGSNVFDILVGLGVPWFINSVPGNVVAINSSGLTYSSISLLSTVVFLFGAVYFNRMRLDKKLGIACLVVYAVFITFSIMYETNVFGEFNPPPCPRTRF